ncbi:MAG TPA: CDP-alcohol phosphatidyltransferase family protein [Kribbellaceae bacterium]|jgi:CDP-diacylglycerol--glycerol-3-phosphate 3-phosphatidyltransferase
MAVVSYDVGVDVRVPRARPGFAVGLLGVPNQMTLVRTVVAAAVAVWAFHDGGWRWLVAGYAVYWAGDLLDGMVARLRNEETVVGAVLDVVCDRVNTLLLAGAFISVYPRVAGPILVFLLQFAILDTMLTLAFLLWPGVISPNYFYRVDRPIWLWNWSKPAKALNTAGVIVSLVVAVMYDAYGLAYLVAAVLAAVKLLSAVQLATILSGRTTPAPSS